MYLVSVGVECVYVKGSLVLVLALDCTQCLPQGVGDPSAMLRGRTAGFPKNWVAWPPEGGVGAYNLHTNHEQSISVWCSNSTSHPSSKVDMRCRNNY